MTCLQQCNEFCGVIKIKDLLENIKVPNKTSHSFKDFANNSLILIEKNRFKTMEEFNT